MSLAIDGSAHYLNPFGSTSTPTITLTTTQTNDIIILTANRDGDSIISVSGATLGAFTQIIAPGSSNGADIWACFSSSALTAEVVTITQTHNFDNAYDIFGVSGSNQTSLTGAFDAGGPQTSTTAPISITTVNANTMVIAVFSIIISQSPGASSGYTAVPNSDIDHMITEYKVLSATGTESPGTNGNDGLVNTAAVIAIVQAAGGSPAIPNKIYQTNFAVKRAAHY